ncbi:transglutaminase family protein [Acidisphaera sp. L21]|uniref:transglutaminase-like domain-containing protein n=1 Tax=Acidisphaera sp. L21 TaxID=1641851 RepID=UPI0020B12547|nr:transglutaminase family protein [Acidisphaera sp. L21]
MTLVLSLHPKHNAELLTSQTIRFNPPIPAKPYFDIFGNQCHQILAPGGLLTMSADFEILVSGDHDVVEPTAGQFRVDELPPETLTFLLGSRFCETDRLSNIAWSLFGANKPGWERVQAICDFVHNHIQFGYEYARPDKTAFDAFSEKNGVCRDFTHLAVALCRCMNIPARYCAGYLGDIGIPKPDAPMDFLGYLEVYLNGPQGGRWYVADPRSNSPRIGRLLMAYGRDAADVAISTIFGAAYLAKFEVVTDEIPG